jgi:hypothetical protein
MEEIPDGYSLQYKIDNKGKWIDTDLLGVDIATEGDEENGAKTIIQFQLLNNEGVAINRFDVPIVSDGARGEITKAYSIRTSTSTIKINADTEYDPEYIYANVLRRSGEDVNVLENADPDYPLFAVLNKGSKKTYLDGSEFKESNPNMSKKLSSYDQSISTAQSNCIAIEYYLYKNTDGGWKIIDMESIPYLVDGKNAPVANLTNDVLSIVCDAEGKPEKSFTGTTTFEFYLGTNKQNLANLTVNNPQSDIYTVSANKTSGVVTVSAGTSKVIPDSTDIVITGTCSTSAGNVSLSKTLKVNKLIIGMPGKDGKSGMVIYPAGNWDSSTTYVQETDSTGKPSAAPYVAYSEKTVSGRTYPRYWVLNVPESTGERPDLNSTGDDAVWIEMEHFESVYAEILLSPNALVGSAVFSGDYMFSQNGVGNYKDFDFGTTNPYSSSSSFKPNYCVNLKTGKVWMNGGLTIFDYDGSGQLAGGAIEWNKSGGLAINNAGAVFNIDGSGQLAGGNFRWDENGIIYRRTFEMIEWRHLQDVSTNRVIQFNKGTFWNVSSKQGINFPPQTNQRNYDRWVLVSNRNSSRAEAWTDAGVSYSLPSPPLDDFVVQISQRDWSGASSLITGNFIVKTINGWVETTDIILASDFSGSVTLEWQPRSRYWVVNNSSYMYVKKISSSYYAYLINPQGGTTSEDKIVFLGEGEAPENPLAGVLYVI